VPDMPDLTPPTPPEGEQYDDNFIEDAPEQPPAALVDAPAAPTLPEPPAEVPASRATVPPAAQPAQPAPADNFGERLERLGGEPAPVITPEEFSRLQNAGQVHIDAMGRVRTARRASQADAGVTLRKRRAWYSS
jgi:hypothetical protein